MAGIPQCRRTSQSTRISHRDVACVEVVNSVSRGFTLVCDRRSVIGSTTTGGGFAVDDAAADRAPLMLVRGLARLGAGRTSPSTSATATSRSLRPSGPASRETLNSCAKMPTRSRAWPDRDRRPLCVADTCARRAGGSDRSLVRRSDRRAAARSRTRACGRRDEPGAAERHPCSALLDPEGWLASSCTSIQVARCCNPHTGGVHLRVREHVLSRGGCRRVREVRGPRDRPDLLRGRGCQLPSAPTDGGALQERQPRAFVDRRGRKGPHGAGISFP